MTVTHTEENYLKAIYKIAEKEKKSVSTNAIAAHIKTSAASVSDMLKKLADKELIDYKKYKGVTLTALGIRLSTKLIRKHRLWEVFLVNKLNFRWDQVHDIAEELEHIDSDDLIQRMDVFLGNPKFDPHGDPIPNAEGKFTLRSQQSIVDLITGKSCHLIGVKEHDTPFLEYLNSINVSLGTHIKILDKIDFDGSMKIQIDKQDQIIISQKVSQNLIVKTIQDE